MPTGTGVSYQPGVNGNLTGWVTISVPTAPSVASVLPKSGPLGCGRQVTVTGSHLNGATAVTFGGIPATNVVVVSDTTLTARTPAHGAGTVDVLVTTAVDTSAAVAAARYSYVRAPVITSVSPRRGPTAGGKTVTVLGSNLKGATRVKFGAKSGKLLTGVGHQDHGARSGARGGQGRRPRHHARRHQRQGQAGPLHLSLTGAGLPSMDAARTDDGPDRHGDPGLVLRRCATRGGGSGEPLGLGRARHAIAVRTRVRR